MKPVGRLSMVLPLLTIAVPGGSCRTVSSPEPITEEHWNGRPMNDRLIVYDECCLGGDGRTWNAAVRSAQMREKTTPGS
jgi:hypothetical protein